MPAALLGVCTAVGADGQVPLESLPMLFAFAQSLSRHRWSLFVLAGLILALQVSRAHVHRFGEHDVPYGHSHATQMHALDTGPAADGHELLSEAAVVEDLLVKFSGLGLSIPAIVFLLLAIPRPPGLRAPPLLAARRFSFNTFRPPLRAPPG